MLAEMSQDTASGLANLATTTHSYRTADAQLTDTVAKLIVLVNDTQAMLNTANAEIARLKLATPTQPGSTGTGADAATKRAACIAR